VNIKCSSGISPLCEQAVTAKAYDESQQPIMCEPCIIETNNRLRRLTNANTRQTSNGKRGQSRR
jgi:hypothetical protein